MPHSRNEYANTLTKKRILYVPSCLIVEMLAQLHNSIAAVDPSGNPRAATPELLLLLRRMRQNLRVTADAYEEERIGFFIGDWRDDKQRARKLFFNTMSGLGHVSERLERAERNMLIAAIEGVTAEWSALDRLRCAETGGRRCQAGDVCGSFCDCGAGVWRRAMADSLVAIHDTTDYGSVDCLIILCHGRAKRRLVNAVQHAIRDSGSTETIDPDRIAAVSEARMPPTCRKCSDTAILFRNAYSRK
jgi:hypothetical protein